MFSCTTDRRLGRNAFALAILISGLLCISFARAEDAEAPAKSTTSASVVPSDASWYIASLNNKKQLDLFYNSNAYKALRAIPAVKAAWKQAESEIKKEGGPLEKFKELTEAKENKDLVDLALDAFSHDVFAFGGNNWNDFFKLLQAVNAAQSLGSLQGAAQGMDPNKSQTRAMLKVLEKNAASMRFPDTVFGMKVKEPKKVVAQLERLEKLVTKLANGFAPLKGKVKKTKMAGGEFLTVQLDGSMAPWDEIPLADLEEKKGEFDGLVNALKKQTMTIALGVKGDHVLLGLLGDVKTLEKFAGPSTLMGLPELKMLQKHAKRTLTGISYISADFAKAASGDFDYSEQAKALKSLLEGVEQIKEPQKKAIAKDIDKFYEDIKKLAPKEFAASLSFSFLSERGYEGYDYNFNKHPDWADLDCRLLKNFGSDPILAFAFGFKCDGSIYTSTIAFLKMAYGHFESVALENAGANEKDMYDTIKKAVFPALEKIDNVIVKQIVPALGTKSGVGVVLDAKWKSAQWSQEFPKMEKAMPMLELGLLLGISDADKLTSAMKAFRGSINDLVDAISANVPNGEILGAAKIPEPKTEKVKGGSLVFYPLPEEAKLDPQVQPVTGIGSTASVVALSKKHAERLMTPTELTYKSGPLSRKGNLIGGGILNFVTLVDAATPWIEFGVKEAAGLDKKEADKVLTQVKTGLNVLKCFKGFSSAVYVEGGIVVRHSEIVVKDLEKSTDPEK
jgi:hypothetical protein